MFLVIAEQGYPTQLAFQYLDDLIDVFHNEISKKYGATPSTDLNS